ETPLPSPLKREKHFDLRNKLTDKDLNDFRGLSRSKQTSPPRFGGVRGGRYYKKNVVIYRSHSRLPKKSD
ncbi:hypothetical protein, partial [Prevotella sp.]|uniref:hypothetical protein n=1 Tax=Prevotella sp. TaxID=59823 RepID=UPI0025DB86C5